MYIKNSNVIPAIVLRKLIFYYHYRSITQLLDDLLCFYALAL